MAIKAALAGLAYVHLQGPVGHNETDDLGAEAVDGGLMRQGQVASPAEAQELAESHNGDNKARILASY